MPILSRCLFATCLALCLLSQGAPELPVVARDANSVLPIMGKYLNQGGEFYLALDSSQWAPKLEGAVAKIQSAVETVVPEHDQDDARLAFYFINAFLRDSGLRDLGGIGASSVATAKDMHHSRLFLQHPAGGPKGLFWDAFTAENQPFDLLPRLPATTAYARWCVTRPKPVWGWIKATIDGCGRADIVRDFHEGLARVKKEEGIEIDRLIDSVTGGLGIVVTLDPKTKIRVPVERGQTIEAPAFAGALILEVEDDTIFDLIGKALTADGEEFERIDRDGIRSYSFPEDEFENTGFLTQPAISRFGRYLVLSSSNELLTTLATGKGGLAATPHFQRCQQAMPKQGFAFSYLSPVASGTVHDLVVAAAAADEPKAEEMAVAMLTPLRDLFSWSVSLRTPDGVVCIANQSSGLAQLLLTQNALLPGLALLGAWSEEHGTGGQRVNDASNLKQMGTGLIMYSMDHGDRFPDDLGKLMEMEYTRDGKVYVSPASGTVAPTTAEEVRAGRCDYLYFGKGRTEANCRTEHPIACTKPGLLRKGHVNVLYGDGHVESHEQMPENVKKLIEAMAED
ncbi:MAG: hypothetical protein HN849_33675, partial [Victivallales bacterium]|nr:hypothetical protein [Victivallales bacterium]